MLFGGFYRSLVKVSLVSRSLSLSQFSPSRSLSRALMSNKSCLGHRVSEAWSLPGVIDCAKKEAVISREASGLPSGIENPN